MKSLLKNKNSTCCKDDPDNDTEPKDCLEKWEKEHKEECNIYTIEKATTDKNKEAYDNSLGWETKLKGWCELIETTDEKVKLVVTELDFLLEQVETVCTKSKCTYEVLEKLTCLVKTIFDCLYTYDDSAIGLKDKIEALKKLINCLKDITDKEKTDIIACIEAYEAKIKAICKCQEAVLSKLLETLKCATLLWAFICGELGLGYKLQGIKDVFSGIVHESDDEDCDSEDEEAAPSYPCNHKVVKPMPEFPIKADDSTEMSPKGNAYYVKVKTALKTAVDITKILKDKWIESQKISNKTLTKKNSLNDAIETAKALDTK
ncbi:hypothetical protein [Zobellia sp. 1_MG-2023]|uniref:hypothetical protein n=1 Tax=Zobellia sp. 1_MG-2023 TaxID=3062626 RepID=UPI0026E32541|nr:hypothetical protein [Zobellia sp. 1_MG-2023]MDO6818894.1 hypothetical protein [Zobellia sp. 1_MG-2023]